MEKIVNHIETLLRRHDYVIVPGLGGFLYLRQSAVIRPDSIEPPLMVVVFNPLMNVSDGLLAIEMARMEGISFREASAYIANEVERMKALLKSKKHIEIGSLGSISLDDDNKIIFQPVLHRHLAPANYGLSVLHYTPAQILPSAGDERKVISFTLPSARKMARYAAIGILAVGLFFTTPRLGDRTENLAGLLPADWVLKPYQVIENDFPVVESSEEQVPLILPEIEPEVYPDTVLDKKTLNHHVIVACMATQQAADELCAKLHRMEFHGAHNFPSSKTYRVAIESFASRSEAIRFMEALRISKTQFADAWVLTE